MNKELENKLFECRTPNEFLSMFLDLSFEEKQSVFTEKVEVKKGTELYRIRKVEGFNNPNPDDPKEWGPPPKDKANRQRFNEKGEPVLYVASSADYLEREVRLREDEDYYLAKYICKNTFKVGSFWELNSKVSMLIHKIAMSASGPEELTATEIVLIDEYYNNVQHKTLNELAEDLLAPLYIYRMIPNLYEWTNKLGKIVLSKNKYGIRYDSAYIPLGLSGADRIITLAGEEYGNYVLTEEGYKNIELTSVKRKTAGKIEDLEMMIKEFSKI